MKSLVNFIQEEQDKYILPIGMFSCCEPPYKELERRNKWLDWFFEGIECPDNVIEAAKDYNNDPILEMLNTHSIDKFIEKIKSIYNDIDIHRVYGTDDTKLNIKDEPKDGFYIVKKTKEELDKINNDNKFINILEFFNYYISETQYNKKYSSHKRKIICNETKDTFDSIVQCSEKSLDIFGVHISKSSISEYLRGKNMTAKGYTFSYVN